MTTQKHTAEGWTSGTSVTAAAGSGSGNQLVSVVVTGGTLTAQSAAAIAGSIGLRSIATSASAVCGALANQTGTTSAAMPGSVKFKIPSGGFPQSVTVLRGMDSAEAAQRYRVLVNTAGNIIFGAANYTGAAGTALATSTASYNGKSVRIRFTGQGSTSSTWTFAIFDLGVSASTAAESFSGSAANLGGPIQRTRGGIAAASGTGVTLDWDDLAVSDDGTDPDPAASTPTVTYGPWSGAVTDTGFTAVHVLANTTSARLVASTASNLATSPVYSSPSAPDADGVVKLAVTGLSANTLYYYGIETDSTVLATGRGQVRTDPTSGSQASFAVAFGSCQFDVPSDTTFAALAARTGPNGAARRLIHMGDMNYQDWTTGDTAANVFTQHMTSLGSTSMAPMLAAVPLTYVWDNHDWGGTDSDKNNPAASVVAAGYRKVFPHYSLPATDGKGAWHSWVIGRVRFIQIDPRSQRDPRTDTNGPAKTLLGGEQKTWLKARLADSEPVKIICGSMYWRQDSSTSDRWGSYADEFDELNDYIDASAVGDVYVIFGDRHALCADDGTSAGTRGRPQAGGAPFQQGSTASAETWSAGYYHDDPNTIQAYGWLDITDAGSTITIDYKGYTADGTQRVAMTTAFTVTADGTAALSAASSLTAGAVRSTSGATALSAASSLTAAGTVGTTGAVALSAASGMTSVAVQVVAGAVAMSAASALAAAGTVTQPAVVALTAVSGLTVAGVATTSGAASLAAASNMTTAATVTTAGSSPLSASSNLTAGSVATAAAGVVLAAASGLTADTAGSSSAAAVLSAETTLTASGAATAAAAAAMSATSALTADTTGSQPATTALSAASDLTVGAETAAFGLVVLAVESDLTAGVSALRQVGALLAAVASLVAAATTTGAGSATIPGALTLSGDPLHHAVTGDPIRHSVTGDRARMAVS